MSKASKRRQIQRRREARRRRRAARRMRQLADAGPPASLRVSQHALVRYAERVLGVPMADIEAQILGSIGPKVQTVGDGVFPLTFAPGAKARVRDGVVVTILTKRGRR